jgi:hypothetical protein
MWLISDTSRCATLRVNFASPWFILTTENVHWCLQDTFGIKHIRSYKLSSTRNTACRPEHSSWQTELTVCEEPIARNDWKKDSEWKNLDLINIERWITPPDLSADIQLSTQGPTIVEIPSISEWHVLQERGWSWRRGHFSWNTDVSPLHMGFRTKEICWVVVESGKLGTGSVWWQDQERLMGGLKKEGRWTRTSWKPENKWNTRGRNLYVCRTQICGGGGKNSCIAGHKLLYNATYVLDTQG